MGIDVAAEEKVVVWSAIEVRNLKQMRERDVYENGSGVLGWVIFVEGSSVVDGGLGEVLRCGEVGREVEGGRCGS